jgi:diguanylate cyclase (GGDEF)-like protein/PAS domain S-box-containing protein
MTEDYKQLYEQLSVQVKQLELMVNSFKEEKDAQELIQFSWAVNLGQWYFSNKINRVVCTRHKLEALGYSEQEAPENITMQFFTERVHPDDSVFVLNNMQQHLKGEIPAYEVTYRIQAKDGSWKWFFERGKVIQFDEHGEPELMRGIAFDISEQKRIELLMEKQTAQLQSASKIDFLSDVLNRRGLRERLEYEARRMVRTRRPLSVILLDIDHFKKINDTYGHLIGDDVLAQVAVTLKKSVRNTDIVGRYGGEEFLVILPECDMAGALKIAEKVRAVIRMMEFTAGISVSISAGVGEFIEISIDNLIDQAEQALGEAKKNGRNQVKGFSRP